MDGVSLGDFKLPDGAHEALEKLGVKPRNLGDGVDYYMSGHDQGVAFRFFVHQEKNEKKSKAAKYPIFDSIEMIEWSKDKFNKPTERARFLPEELLTFDPMDPTVCIGGRFKDAYERFKKGLDAPGLALSKWGVLSDSDVATLKELRIYTVEQFAAQARTKIVGKFHKEIEDAYELAIKWNDGKDGRELASKTEQKLADVYIENEGLKKQMAEMQEQMKTLLSMQGDAKKGKKSKEIEAE